MAEGAKNVVKLLGSRRMQDRKALAEVRPLSPPVASPLEGSPCSHPPSAAMGWQ